MFYFEGTLTFGLVFPGVVMEVQILVLKPYLISDFLGHRAGINAVFHEKGGLFVGGDGFFPSFGQKAEAFFQFWEEDLSDF